MEREEKVPKSVEKIVKMIVKLEPEQFIGVCKILGVELIKENGQPQYTADSEEEKASAKIEVSVEVRPAEELIKEVIDKTIALNRTQRKNLTRLLKAATKGD
jgi:hypothetical protein